MQTSPEVVICHEASFSLHTFMFDVHEGEFTTFPNAARSNTTERKSPTVHPEYPRSIGSILSGESGTYQPIICTPTQSPLTHHR